MNLNPYILNDYLEIPVEKTWLNSSPLELDLECISFYRQGIPLQGHHVYLILAERMESILTPKLSGCFVCLGTLRALPRSITADILILDGNLDPLDVYESVQEVFHRFSQWERRLLQMVKENAPMNHLGNSALEFLYNPISMYTPSLRLVFYSERSKPRQEKLYFEEELDTYLPDFEIDDLKLDPEFIESLNAVEPAIFSANRWGYRILFYNIRITDIYVARLMVLETDRPFRQSDACLLRFLAGFVTHMLEKQNLNLNNHPKDFDTCIQKLLSGIKPELPLFETILSEVHWQAEDAYICAVIQISRYDKAIQTVSALCPRLESNIPGSAAFLLEEYILLLVNLSASSRSKEESLMPLAYILREGLLKAGISNQFSSLFLLADYFSQAKSALRIGSVQDETIWCYHYKNYALYDLAENALSGRSVVSLCPEGLLRLMEYDKRHRRNLTYALKIYLEQNMNIAKTIRSLFLQRATFLYQLKRIQEISQLDLDNPKIRLELLMVFEIMEEHGADLRQPQSVF